MIGNLLLAVALSTGIGFTNIGTNNGLQIKTLDNFETSVGVAKEIDFHLQSSLLPNFYNCVLYDYSNGSQVYHSDSVSDAYINAYPSSYLYDTSYSFKINYNISNANNGYIVLAVFPCWQIDRFYYTDNNNEQVALFDSYCHVKGGLTFTSPRPSIVASGISVNPAFSHLFMTSWIAFPNSDNFVDWFNYDLDSLHSGYDGFSNPTPIIFSGCNYGYFFTMESADYNSPNWSLDLTFTFFTPLVKDYASNGYSVGYQTGWNDGYSEAQNTAYHNGYIDGQNAGMQISQTSFMSLFASIVDTPMRMLYSLFNFDLFGTSMLIIILSTLTAIVVIKILKKFI